MAVNAFQEITLLCFYGNVLLMSFTVILWPLDYGTVTRGNQGLSDTFLRNVGVRGAVLRNRPPDIYTARDSCIYHVFKRLLMVQATREITRPI
jgi:hypothetical protein